MTADAGRRGDGEAGFTLVELMVAMLILTTVMAALLGVLDSQTRAERRVQTYANNQEVLRQAVVAMQRDIRSSEPLRKLPTAPEYALRIDLDIYEEITDAATVGIRWRVDTASRELRREVLDGGGNVRAVTHRVTGVANSYAAPLFSFYNANSSVADENIGRFDLATANPADVASCSVRVRIALVAAPSPGPAPARLLSDAQLRNRLPGGTGCPVISASGVG